MFRSLIPRTLALLVLATAIVAASVALGLPERRGVGVDHGGVAADHDAMARPAGDEAGFVLGMIPHHQEAVDVAQVVLERGERPEVRALAETIVATQAQEIERLETWRSAWFAEAAPVAYVPMMRSLEVLEADAVDRTFVEDMIHHHEMAIGMAQVALDGGELRPEVEALARDVVRVQAEEIAVLQGWLEAWDDASGTDGR